MPFSYPLFLSLEGEHCLVAGLGEVGRRKLAGLLAAGVGSVLALESGLPAPAGESTDDDELARLCADPRVHLERRPCTEADVRASRLVFAATSHARENARIAALCREAGVLCNCASAPELGAFAVPAVARAGELRAALSTGGASPALTRILRRELELWLAPRAALARFLGRLRPLVLAMGADTRHNSQLFRKVAASPLGDWLAAGDLARCRAWLERELPPALAAQALPLLDGPADVPAAKAPGGTDGEPHEFC
ncbi:MAG: bifunctional precorrin-2 dehydrogenase/sirohydrochlorin ferrochelatase [Desulfovibrio sp.]|uniref:precorrin-2 dehydrogenase/sirohydrochlorin ferrochelatase family protein n=1 Tax=Desulfovibrio sp. TaxID=885 RepID=UPI001A6C6F06|nr:bifunctional precorrin-2 dehydrogenase/sirohydrochlorin ferrochelatase [Desulfovibrio sp.]MBD5417836.1 bifunctional precorrin-2 dehydrogenase/sirohydrochlorin ferrochelatase [Desulfovibrio sp.]